MEEMSNSQKKRLARQKAIQDEKRAKIKEKVITVSVIVAFIAIIAAAMIYNYRKAQSTYVPLTNFSAMINADGSLKGVDVKKAVGDISPSDIKIDKNTIAYTEENAENEISHLLDQHRTYITEGDHEMADGDRINLDFVGKVDGKEFEGGSSNGEGYELVLGSNSFVDDFEAQLVGSKIGDDVTVEVTFPEDYGNKELNGKDAVFECHINGYYEDREFNDEFVKEFLSEYASTAEEYKQYLIDNAYTQNLDYAIDNWLYENATVSEYDKNYLHYMEEYVMNMDRSSYDQMQQMYKNYGMESPYADYDAYLAENYEDYEAHRLEEAQRLVAVNEYYQVFYEQSGLKLTEEDFDAFVARYNLSEEAIQSYGRPYLTQEAIHDKVREWLRDKVDIGNYPATEDTSDISASDDDVVIEDVTTEPEADQEEAEQEETESESVESQTVETESAEITTQPAED